MSSSSFNPQAHLAIQTLRTQLTEDLMTFLDADVHLSGYIVAWVGRNLELDDLEALVDELDGVYRLPGDRSVLERRPKK